MNKEVQRPKIFISYSWTSQEHEQWVEDLAIELVESDVDVILDKWHLKPGHDANLFMEKMVTDPEIKKVILVCDKVYVEKANKRHGGAGTEAQIISPELYKGESNQNKFVAVIREKDENENAYAPAYYSSRIHIDFSNDDKHTKAFEELIRWIYDKPLHKMPPFGKRPAYLNESSTVSLPTKSEYRRTLEAVRNGRPNAIGALQDYFNLFLSELENFRLVSTSKPKEEEIIRLINDFLPVRNELLDLIFSVIRYQDNALVWDVIGMFLEQLLEYSGWREHSQSWSEWDADHYRFFMHELMLHLVGFAIKEKRFNFLKFLLNHDMYYENKIRGVRKMVSYVQFIQHLSSIEAANNKASTQYYSLHAKMLVDRAKHAFVGEKEIFEADFLLYLHSSIVKKEGPNWYPFVATCFQTRSIPSEFFIRCKSVKMFNIFLDLFCLKSKDDFGRELDIITTNVNDLPTIGYNRLNPKQIINFEDLSTTS